jgi:hypothetical protein
MLRLANASVGRVDRLYQPERLNFAPRIGLAWDPFGDGKSSLRAGFSLAFVLFSKFFPVISIWETEKEDREREKTA